MTTAPFPVELRPWFHRYARWLARDARGAFVVGELESVADLAALRAWRSYDADAGFTFRTYARYAVLGAVRRAVGCHRRRTRHVDVGGVGEEPDDRRPSADVVLAARRALAALAEADRALLLRHVLADEPLDALAADLALPKTTVWRRIQRAKRRARQAISRRSDPAPTALTRRRSP